MSVAVLVEYHTEGREPLYLPLGSEGPFWRYWLAAAKKLSLTWVPLFESGIDVPVEHLWEVVGELRQIRVEFEQRGDATGERLLERIDFAISALSKVNLDEVAEIYIG